MKDSIKNGAAIDYFSAASAGVAQSVALASQNAVDALHNQNVVKLAALGGAYSKWLANPQMASEFKELAETVSLDQQKGIVIGGLTEFVNTVMDPSSIA